MESNSKEDAVVNDKDKVDAAKVPNTANHSQEESRDEPDPRSFFWNSGQKRKTAKMPVEKDAWYYKMNHRNRGIAVILNHEQFDVNKLKQRNGTTVDKKSLELVLNNLGFEVWSYTDLTFNEVEQVIKKAAAYDHQNSDCFLLAVLTHGEQGILYAKDMPYDPQLLWGPFTGDKCTDLAGKPKLFFIQACQGDSLDGGIELRSRTEMDSSPSYRIPNHADFLIAFSTVPGYYSWRNTTKGSWFIQALCEELERSAFDWDLMTVLTSVLRKVAVDYESNVPDNPLMHNQKQMPYITYMLTRLVQFTRR